jgi:hypothetical protein
MRTATTFLVAAVAAENVVSAVTVDLAMIAETVVLVTAMTVVLVTVMIVDLAKTAAHVKTVHLVKIVHLVLTVLSKSHSKQNLIAKSAQSSVTLVPIPVVETTVVATAVIVAVDNHCQRLRSFT